MTRARDRAVGVLDDLRDLGPVGAAIEPHAEPTAMPDVSRHVEPIGLLADELRLRTGRRRAPEPENAVAVMVVVERHERLLARDEPRRRAVTQSLGGLGQRHADRTHTLERSLPGHAARLGFHPWRVTLMRSSSTSPGMPSASRARARCCSPSGARRSSTSSTTTSRSPSRSCARSADGRCSWSATRTAPRGRRSSRSVCPTTRPTGSPPRSSARRTARLRMRW